MAKIIIQQVDIKNLQSLTERIQRTFAAIDLEMSLGVELPGISEGEALEAVASWDEPVSVE